MAVLTPVPKIQFFDANGNPLVGGKLYSYSAGTTTPLPTYTDYGGATPNTNPVILDSRGEANVWLGNSLYKFKLTSATDVEIWTVDNIGGADQATLAQLAASGGSNLVGFLQSGTGAVARTAQAKMRETISVSDFGVVGDGVVDDTAALLLAINAINAYSSATNYPVGSGVASAVMVGAALEIPAGMKIKVSDTLPVPKALVSFGGASIVMTDSSKDIFSGNDVYKCDFYNVNFVGGKSHIVVKNSNTNFGLWLFEKCTFVGSSDYSVQCLNLSGTYPVTSTQPIFNDCYWSRNKRILKTQADHTYVNGGWMQVSGDWFDANTAAILTEGYLSLNGIIMVPFGTGEPIPARSRWIDNYGAVRAHQVRFGGESGGLPVVYQFADLERFIAGVPNSSDAGVIFSECILFGGNLARADQSIIYIQGQLPAAIRFTDCTGPVNAALVKNNPADGGIADIDAYIAAKKAAWSGDNMFWELAYSWKGAKIRRGATLLWPAQLDRYFKTDAQPVQCKGVSSGPTVVASGVQTRLSVPTAEFDDQYLIGLDAGVYVIRAPAYAKKVTATGWIEVSSHSATNSIYTARLYVNSNPIVGAHVNYQHVVSGIARLTVTGSALVSENDSISLQFLQSSGSDKTVSECTLFTEFTVQ